MAKQEYIERNIQWLAAKAQEVGVLPIDKGVYYKVIRPGNAKSPTPNRGSVITVHYTGKTINGKTFDSSRGGAPCFSSARPYSGMDNCHSADACRRPLEIYIPASQGYGRISQPGIPGGSTLIFDIELKAIN